MRAGLSIGEFATVTRLSVRTLRRYHEAGLLGPTAVDHFTGYRYYTSEQIPTAQVIQKLRQLDVPLAEVKSILASGDPEHRAEMIASHQGSIARRLMREPSRVNR
ncbi:MerR family transcriptional regulator [Mycolicibacterium monacense]|uniref:MerR family transcriptional regulator n=1 Tax=Mycolicibacterium monacense TaxID=85693 RepID=UPI002285FBD0|nr:MerR family transcriptional regulator [Mycolicibacterium monacense]